MRQYRYFIVLSALLIIILFSCRNEYDEAWENEEIKIKEYLQKNNLEVIPTDDGIYFISIYKTDGDSIEAGNFIIANINGAILGDEIEEKNVVSNLPILIGESNLIKGLELGITLMHEGEKAQLIIPFELAYYSPLSGIPNYNTYLFEIEIVEIVDSAFAWEMNRINDYLINNNYNIAPDTTGFCYIKIIEGDGDLIELGDSVEIDYETTLLDGTILFNSEENKPFSFNVDYFNPIFENDTIFNRGFVNGITQMKEHGEARIILPSSMAYGQRSIGTYIHPYSTLVFHVSDLTILNK